MATAISTLGTRQRRAGNRTPTIVETLRSKRDGRMGKLTAAAAIKVVEALQPEPARPPAPPPRTRLYPLEPAPAAKVAVPPPEPPKKRGRPVGSKNRSTILREAITAADEEPEHAPRPVAPATLPVADPATLAEQFCSDIVPHHRRLQFMIRTRIILNNRSLAFVRVNVLGWSMSMPEAERSKITKEAARLVTQVRAGDRSDPLLSAFLEVADGPTKIIEDYSHKTEIAMVGLAKRLPGRAFVEATPGLGWLSFARIVGEAGPLHQYATPSRLWKRMGLAVIAGERQRLYADLELNALHSHNPRRRSVSWVVFDSVLKTQLRKNAETGETEGVGYFGKLYLERKAILAARAVAEDWPENSRKLHVHRAAARYSEKRLLKLLWRAWRRDVGVATNYPPHEGDQDAAEPGIIPLEDDVHTDGGSQDR